MRACVGVCACVCGCVFVCESVCGVGARGREECEDLTFEQRLKEIVPSWVRGHYDLINLIVGGFCKELQGKTL